MILIKKNLKTVKNKLLCELEDIIMDFVLPLMTGDEMSKEAASELMVELIQTIRDNSERFAIICYTDEDGKDLTKKSLKNVPVKIKLIQEVLPDLMEILSDYVQGEGKSEGKPKAKRIRKR